MRDGLNMRGDGIPDAELLDALRDGSVMKPFGELPDDQQIGVYFRPEDVDRVNELLDDCCGGPVFALRDSWMLKLYRQYAFSRVAVCSCGARYRYLGICQPTNEQITAQKCSVCGKPCLQPLECPRIDSDHQPDTDVTQTPDRASPINPAALATDLPPAE